MGPADMDHKTEKTTGASPKAMDPERLARLQRNLRAREAEYLASGKCLTPALSDSLALLLDRDHWEAEVRKTDALLIQALTKRDDARAEAKRYRDRCPVTAEDVKAAGLSPRVIRSANPFWTAESSAMAPIRDSSGASEGPVTSAAVARTINFKARQEGRPAFDILDEMAPQEAP